MVDEGDCSGSVGVGGSDHLGSLDGRKRVGFMRQGDGSVDMGSRSACTGHA